MKLIKNTSVGFTLIEVCLVVGVLLLVVGLMVPSFHRLLASHRLDQEAYRLALVLTQARQLARHNQEEIQVFIDAKTNEVKVQSSSGKIFEETLDPSLKIEAATLSFYFNTQTLPLRQEIRVTAQNGFSRQLTVEPFLNHVQIQ